MVVLAPSPALSEPAAIPSIALTEAGPDKEIPTSGAFYLTGKIPAQVHGVHVVFVRAAYPFLGLGERRSCAEVANALGRDNLAKDNGKLLLETLTGIQPIEKIWTLTGTHDPSTYDALNTWQEAYVPPPWLRPTSEEEKKKPSESYAVLVSEPRFFRPGATYCMFTYEKHLIDKNDRDRVRSKIWKYQKLRAACLADPNPGTCNASANEALGCDLRCLGSKPEGGASCKYLEQQAKTPAPSFTCSEPDPGKKGEALNKAVRERLVADAERIVGLDASFDKSLQVAPTPKLLATPWQPSSSFAPIEHDALSRLILEGLFIKGIVHRQVNPRGKNCAARPPAPPPDPGAGACGVEYYTRGGDLIRSLWLRPDFEEIQVAARRAPKAVEVKKIPLPASDIPVDGGINLADILRLARGQIRVGDGYLTFQGAGGLKDKSIEPVTSRIAEVLEKEGDLPADLPSLQSLQQHVEALRTAVQHACDKKTSSPSIAQAAELAPEDAVRAFAGHWLDGEALSGCTSYTSPPPPPAPGAPAPPGPDNFLRSLSTTLLEYDRAVKSWRDNQEAIANQWKEIRVESPRRQVEVASRFTQQTYVETYMTPFLGYAWAVKPGTDFDIPYVGIHVTAFPDPVAEPMWSNGRRDWRRLPALELGVAVSSPSYGDGGRFSGPWGLPPLFVGISHQFIPWVTASGGVVLMQYRRTTLSTERAEIYSSFYLAFTAQLNFVNIIRTLAIGGSTAVTETKK
ncbi:hypothetical protein WMF38_05980 [Sorangium sp. So ce118]